MHICINFDKKSVGLHSGLLFHKLIWPPCLHTSQSPFHKTPAGTFCHGNIPEDKKGVLKQNIQLFSWLSAQNEMTANLKKKTGADTILDDVTHFELKFFLKRLPRVRSEPGSS
jgi:hypothetical protein